MSKLSDAAAGGDIPEVTSSVIDEEVIRILLEEADLELLKELREFNANWNDLSIKELCKRASEGLLKPIDLSRKNNDMAIQEKLAMFLEDTSGNPQLFQSFRLHFSKSLEVQDSSLFFTKYSPAYLHLVVGKNFEVTEESSKVLQKSFRRMSLSLKELKLEIKSKHHQQAQPLLSWAVPQDSFVFPNLSRISCKDSTLGNKIQGFKFILDKSGKVDPTPNLNELDLELRYDLSKFTQPNPESTPNAARWSKLTHLQITRMCGNSESSALLNMSVEGMRLKSFDIKMWFRNGGDWTNIACSNFSQFFDLQASSLEILKFRLEVPKCEDARGLIRLPVFEKVYSLYLMVCFMRGWTGISIERRVFEMGPLSRHFPNLEDLVVRKELLRTLYPQDGTLVKPLDLKYLFISGQFGGNDDFGAWGNFLERKFRSVVSLKCDSNLAQAVVLPWIESLKTLQTHYVEEPIKLSHLTNLQNLIVLHCGQIIPIKYPSYFDEALNLNLESIKFRLDSGVSERAKSVLAKYFPFKVEFEF